MEKKILSNTSLELINSIVDSEYVALITGRVFKNKEEVSLYILEKGIRDGVSPNSLLDWRFLEEEYTLALDSVDELCDFLASHDGDYSEHFSKEKYYQANPDVATANVNSLVHCISHAVHENRLISLDKGTLYEVFRENCLLSLGKTWSPLYLDSASALVNAPSDFFDKKAYEYLSKKTFKSIDAAKIDFCTKGYRSGISPNLAIDLPYLKNKGIFDYRLVENNIAALLDFTLRTTKKLSYLWDPEIYCETNKDVQLQGATYHLLNHGIREERYIDHDGETYETMSEKYLSANRNLGIKKFKINSINLEPGKIDVDFSLAKALENFTYNEIPDEVSVTSSELFKKPRVLIIGDLNIFQCRKYRVNQKIELLNNLGIEVELSPWDDQARCLYNMQFSTLVIFYRLPMCGLVSSYYDECNRLNIQTAYDIDDPIYDMKLMLDNDNLSYVSKLVSDGIISSVRLYLNAMRRADLLIGSTPGICENIRKKVKAPCILWRNVIDTQTTQSIKYNQMTGIDKYYDESKGGKFVVGYMSGSHAHEADFLVAYDNLCQFLENYPDTSLLTVGHCKHVSYIQSRFPGRVECMGFSGYTDYLSYFNKIDVNIIPLQQNTFNHCKSAIRFLEASLHSKPTIVSTTGDFVNQIENGKNGILVNNDDYLAWYNALKTFYLDQASMHSIGASANKYVAAQQTVDAITESLEAQLKTHTTVTI